MKLLALSVLVLLAGAWPASKLGSEFMPPLDEGDWMYMPTTFAAISIGKARQLLQQTDKLIKTVPEVERVFGKVGRAEGEWRGSRIGLWWGGGISGGRYR